MDIIKSLDIEPNNKNLTENLKKDTVGRNKDIFSFISLLKRIEGHYILALDGQWGSGKTFFVRQCGLLLSNENLFSEISKKNGVIGSFPDYNYIYYDAWENDDESDPIASVMYQIMQQTSLPPDIKIQSLIPLISETTKLLLGKDPVSVINALIETVKGAKDVNATSAENNAKLKKTVEQFLEKISKDKKTIIFIDELDRCNPTYAVKLLERIKHYFNHDHIVFVFSTNIVELSKTIKEYYGTDFNGERYLDRFFDSKVILPAVNKEKYWQSEYIDINDPNYYFYLTCQRVINYCDFSLREIDHFRINAEEILDIHLIEDDNRISRLIKFGFAPILLGLKMLSLDEYNKFVIGNGINLYKTIIAPIQDSWLKELNLLEPNETYRETSETIRDGFKTIDPNKYITELYTKIFTNNFREDSSLRVGTLEIPNHTKETIVRIINLFNLE